MEQHVFAQQKKILNFLFHLFIKLKNEVFFIRNGNSDDEKIPYEMSIFYKSNVYHLKIFKSVYEEYSLEFNENRVIHLK